MARSITGCRCTTTTCYCRPDPWPSTTASTSNVITSYVRAASVGANGYSRRFPIRPAPKPYVPLRPPRVSLPAPSLRFRAAPPPPVEQRREVLAARAQARRT